MLQNQKEDERILPKQLREEVVAEEEDAEGAIEEEEEDAVVVGEDFRKI